jgi:hypothetical protein
MSLSQRDQPIPEQARKAKMNCPVCWSVESGSAGSNLTEPSLVRGRRQEGWDLDRDLSLLETGISGILAARDGSAAMHCVHQYLSRV